jgi:acyl carrier protein
METTLAQLTTVFQDVFDDDAIVLTLDTSADDIKDWDSLMHVTLVKNVERAFGLRFTSAQVALLTDVGDLVGLIESMRTSASAQSEG